MKKGDLIKLTKVSDDFFNGNHPNGIYEGYTRIGELQDDITVGKRCHIVHPLTGEYLSTSDVVSFDGEFMITTYSTYKAELLKDSEEDKNSAIL